MPYKHGPGTYKGYQSPNTRGYPVGVRNTVRRVYGAYRSDHPGEDREIKARGSRIAWAAAKKKYPEAFQKIEQETKKEQKEHPWASKRTARRIAADHVGKARRRLKPIRSVRPATTRQARQAQIRDLKASAREQARWSKEAENEAKNDRKAAQTARKRGNPIQARDLNQDAKLAHSFAQHRKKKADDYEIQAARIAAVKGD